MASIGLESLLQRTGSADHILFYLNENNLGLLALFKEGNVNNSFVFLLLSSSHLSSGVQIVAWAHKNFVVKYLQGQHVFSDR